MDEMLDQMMTQATSGAWHYWLVALALIFFLFAMFFVVPDFWEDE